jgi:hypothetical protein
LVNGSARDAGRAQALDNGEHGNATYHGFPVREAAASVSLNP